MRLNRRIPSWVLLWAAIAVAGLPPVQAQEYRRDGSVRPDRVLSPDESVGEPALSPAAVRPDKALAPDRTDSGPVSSPGAVRPDRALAPDETDAAPVL